MRYAVIVEEGENNFGAHVPDLPGCIAVSDTKEEVLELIQEAIEFHIARSHRVSYRRTARRWPANSSTVFEH